MLLTCCTRPQPVPPLIRSAIVETLLRDAVRTRAEIKKVLGEDHAELVATLPKTGEGSIDDALEVRVG